MPPADRAGSNILSSGTAGQPPFHHSKGSSAVFIVKKSKTFKFPLILSDDH